jgi:hypothetical protein
MVLLLLLLVSEPFFFGEARRDEVIIAARVFVNGRNLNEVVGFLRTYVHTTGLPISRANFVR